MAIEAVKATIRQGNQAVDDAKRTMESANADLIDGTAMVLAALHDTGNEEAEQARKKLSDAAHEIKLTLRRLAAAKSQAESYLETLG